MSDAHRSRVAEAINEGENRYRQTVLGQGPLDGYPKIEAFVHAAADGTTCSHCGLELEAGAAVYVAALGTAHVRCPDGQQANRVDSVSHGPAADGQNNDPGGSRTRDLRIKRSSVQGDTLEPTETNASTLGTEAEPINPGSDGLAQAGASIACQVEPLWARSVYRLRLLGDPVLERVCDDFDPKDAAYLPALTHAMKGVVEKHRGLGLSAPQVGAPVCVIVANLGRGLEVMVNPIITSRSHKLKWRVEGCLSIPRFERQMYRHESVTVDYLDEAMAPQQQTLAGRQAQIIQHEVDHLFGFLLTYNVSPKKLAHAQQLVERAKARGEV